MCWIDIKEKVPPVNKVVDLWADGERRCEYILTKNYAGKKGNNFFSPVRGGIACIRYDGSEYFTNATHWMYPPKPPKKSKKSK